MLRSAFSFAIIRETAGALARRLSQTLARFDDVANTYFDARYFESMMSFKMRPY